MTRGWPALKARTTSAARRSGSPLGKMRVSRVTYGR